MAEVVLQGVSKTYSGHAAAVEDLDLTIRDQELVVLVGPSGCGKTTTLRLIAGLEDPSRGMIRIDGRPVNQVAPRDRNIAMVFQHSALYPHLSVFDNMAFGLRMRRGGESWGRRWTGKWRQKVATAVAEASGALALEHLLDRKPHELSGGERQRVALGRAIVRQPAAFLFDEPLAHLDPQRRVEVRQMVSRLQRHAGVAMLYVTHDQSEAMSLGDRIVVMDRGRIQQIGTPRRLYTWPANQFVARFLGEPAMNLIAGRVLAPQANEDRCRFVGGGLTVPLGRSTARPGLGPVVLGIRPEHVKIRPIVSARVHSVTHRGPVAKSGWETQGPRDPLTSGGGVGSIIRVELLGAVTVVAVVPGDRSTEGGDVGQLSDTRRGTALADAPSKELLVAVPSETKLDVQDPVAIEIDETRVHWFDAETGANLAESASG